MEIDLELTEKLAKNIQRWWKLTATIDVKTVVWEIVQKCIVKNVITKM